MRSGLASKKKFIWAKKPKSLHKPKRRLVACGGVPEIKRWPAEACERLVTIVGRRRRRCGTCFVLKAWREKLAGTDPEIVVKIIVKLAAEGRI